MDDCDIAVVVTVGCILGATILSGPLVGAIDLAEEEGSPAPGLGSATVSVESFPDGGVTIAEGRYDAGSFYLTVPDATVAVRSVEGNPIVAYRISIPDLGFVRVTVHVLEPEMTGSVRIELERATFSPDRITEERYEAVLSLEYRSGETVERLIEERVTVGVERR